MKNILLAVILSAGLFGCSNWNQDPLKNKDGVLASGQSKPVELVEPKPLASDAVRILAPDFMRFKENEAGELIVAVRNLLPGYSVQVAIDNLTDFPGATFDAASGKFAWTPAKGLILPVELEKAMTLKVRTVATLAGSATVFSEKEIQIILNRAFVKPVISSITKASPIMREGEVLDISVLINDVDADPLDQKTWCSLNIKPTMWQKSLSGYMSLKSYRFVSGSTFEALFTVDLRNAEVSEGLDTLYFDINVLTRFNQLSDNQTQNVNIYTQFSDLRSTWSTVIEGKIGTVINYQFLVYDPKGELKVSFEGLKNEIKGSATKCTNATTSVLSCTFIYDTTVATTPALVPAVSTFNLSTKSKNQITADTFEVAKDFKFTLNLVK